MLATVAGSSILALVLSKKSFVFELQMSEHNTGLDTEKCQDEKYLGGANQE